MKFLVLFAAAGSATLLYKSDNHQTLLARNPQLSLQSVNYFSRLSPRSSTPYDSVLHPRGLGSKLRACIGTLCGKSSTENDQSTRGPGFRRTSIAAVHQDSPGQSETQPPPIQSPRSAPAAAANLQRTSPRRADSPTTSSASIGPVIPPTRINTPPPSSRPVLGSQTSSRGNSSPRAGTSRPANALPANRVSNDIPIIGEPSNSGSRTHRQLVSSRRDSLDRSWADQMSRRGRGASGTDPMPGIDLPRQVADVLGASPSTWQRPYAQVYASQPITQRMDINLSSRSSSDEGRSYFDDWH